jgi:hypothetical protein
MRILHVLDHSLPLHSGYSFRTVAILREQRRLGWQTRQLTTPRQRALQLVEDIDGWRFDRTLLRSSPWSRVPGLLHIEEMTTTARRIREVAIDFAPDIIHAHSPVLNALPALWTGRRLGLPVVYEVRALWEDAAVDHGMTREGSPRYAASRALETFALRHADRITTICDGLRDEIASRGVAADRITVIPNAVDINEFRPCSVDVQLRAELGLNGTTVIGFAGSFYAYEGLDLLIEALARLASDHREVRLLLIGGGPQETNLRALVDARKLTDGVVFAGRVPHADMPRYYGLIDLLCYPRRRIRLTEIVTPLKPLEAMAQQKPLIASDIGGHRELIRDDETGFLFPADDAAALADAIRSALARRDQWPRLQTNGRRFVETERNWARSVAGYAPVYGSLREFAPAKSFTPPA